MVWARKEGGQLERLDLISKKNLRERDHVGNMREWGGKTKAHTWGGKIRKDGCDRRERQACLSPGNGWTTELPTGLEMNRH